jgi:hypothetical protein
MFQHSLVFRLFSLAWLSIGLPEIATADIVILGSDVPALPSGKVLKDAEDLTVPAGGIVRFMTPSGRAELLTGPVSKRVGELSGVKGAADPELWSAVTARLSGDFESGSSEETTTRSMAEPETSLSAYRFSWTDIPITATGDICVEKGATLRIVRTSDEKGASATLIDLQSGGRRAEIAFPAGVKSVPWPAEIAPRVGNFALQGDGSGARSFRLRLISPLPNAQEALRVLHGQRCELQRNALLDALKDPKFQISALAE